MEQRRYKLGKKLEIEMITWKRTIAIEEETIEGKLEIEMISGSKCSPRFSKSPSHAWHKRTLTWRDTFCKLVWNSRKLIHMCLNPNSGSKGCWFLKKINPLKIINRREEFGSGKHVIVDILFIICRYLQST